MNVTDKSGSKTSCRVSYKEAYEKEFALARDINNLYGEQNQFRYLPLESMALRLFKDDSEEMVRMVACAASLCGTPLTISFGEDYEHTEALSGLGCSLKKESLESFIDSMSLYERIRTCRKEIPMAMYEAAAAIDKYIATATPVNNGRVELVNYIKEQSISFEYHRYGSVSEVPE